MRKLQEIVKKHSVTKNCSDLSLLEEIVPLYHFLQLRDDWEKNNKALSDKMRRMSKDLNEKSESVQYTVFEAMQTIMDYIEESFENVMLPCTPGKALEGLGTL